MLNRLSQTVLRPGDYSIDKDAEVGAGELHYLLADTWGSLSICVTGGQAGWAPLFTAAPDWGQIETWLKRVHSSMCKDYGFEAKGFVGQCLNHLTMNYRPPE